MLNPDAHMFVQEDFYQSELSLKRGLKEWGDKAYTAAESEMKQFHFRNTLEGAHRHPTPNSVGVSHVSQGETRWKDQRANRGQR
jgi:hypothetical protein